MNANRSKASHDRAGPNSAGAAKPDVETELKFLIASEDLETILLLPALRDALTQPRREKLEAVYFDTPDQMLWRHGFILRVRKSAQGFVQTVKQETGSAVQRGEWEREIERGALDLPAIEQTPLAHLISRRRLREALRPAFEVHVERMSFLLDHGEARIEGAIDRGEIEAAGRTLPISELELELKLGDQGALFDLARVVSSQGPLLLSFLSKAERGHLLAQGAWGRSAKASKLRLDAGMTCGQAFQSICRSCLHDFMLNEAGFATSDRVEAIHQGRIAIRRLRAAMTLFKPMVRDDAYVKLQDELKWLAGLLGAARDLDVLCAKLPPLAEGGAAHAGLQAFADRVEAKRRRFHQTVLEGTRTERARSLLVEMAAWIENGRWRKQAGDLPDARVASFAGMRLKKRAQALVRQGADLADLGPEARHRVRIEAKKLRYMGEFFVDVLDEVANRKQLKRLVDALGELQTALGEMRDEEAKSDLVEAEVRSWREEGNGLDEAAIAAAEQWGAARIDTSEELGKAISAYKALAKADPF